MNPPIPAPGEVEEVPPEEPPTPPEPADDCRCPVPFGEVMTDDCAPPLGAGPTCGDQTCRARVDDPSVIPTVYTCVYEHSPSEPWEEPPEAEPCSCPTGEGEFVVSECGSVFGEAVCSDHSCLVDVGGTLESRACTDMPVIVSAQSSPALPAHR